MDRFRPDFCRTRLPGLSLVPPADFVIFLMSGFPSAVWVRQHRTSLVCEGVDTVYIERLNLEAMTRRGGRHKKGLNRGMRFIRHGAILRKFRIAAEWLGIGVTEVNPRGTSPECNACGYSHRQPERGNIPVHGVRAH